MTTNASQLPGTYRESDLSKVEFSAAIDAWIPLAYEALLSTGQKYNNLITYLELSEYVQSSSGIRTRVLLTNWIGKLLEAVAQLAKANGDPPLTSLCVHQDGTIGEAIPTPQNPSGTHQGKTSSTTQRSIDCSAIRGTHLMYPPVEANPR